MLDACVERIRREVAALRFVAGAADLAGLSAEKLKAAPMGWVVPLSETASNNELNSGAISQRLTKSIGVVIVARNVRDARGEAARKDLEYLRDGVRKALIGWAPDINHDPIIYSRGRLLSMGDGAVWWQDEYQTATYLRVT